jgi:hypothetical protein
MSRIGIRGRWVSSSCGIKELAELVLITSVVREPAAAEAAATDVPNQANMR